MKMKMVNPYGQARVSWVSTAWSRTREVAAVPDLEPWGRKWTRRQRLALPTYVTPPVRRALFGVPFIV